MMMETDAPAVLSHGVALGRETWHDFQESMKWTAESVDRVFCHQVTRGHQRAILDAFGISPEKDFSTVEFLGNTGTVALPATLAIGAERGLTKPGDRLGLLGIGSGLNCIMLGVRW
jgi:3-oxoacyl-[acyl-carrier-protein] synthase-3